MLFQKGGAAAFFLRLLVSSPRRFPFTDLRPYHPLPNLHLHRIHRCTGGGRKDINRLNRGIALVLILLGNHHIRDDSGDVDFRIGRF